MSTSLETNSQQCFQSNSHMEEENGNDDYEETYKKYRDIIPTLAHEEGWMNEQLVKYQGVWLTPSPALKGFMLVQQHFEALPTDIFLATSPKSGTTWFKALVFTIMNRATFQLAMHHPLLTNGPHDCIPFLETSLITQSQSQSQSQSHHISTSDLNCPSPLPRLFSTHIPYPSLPPSLKASGCRFVYVLRNPKDVFISSWHFYKDLRPKELPPLSIEEALELFCKGVSRWGPFWDHVLGYWNASLESPKKVLFITYEDVMEEPLTYIKKLAEFLGQPFSSEEERGGMVEEIVRLCSFENLSNLEVNKMGIKQFTPEMVLENKVFFRKGQVGDWENHLTVEMMQRLDKITEQKFGGTSLMHHISK